MARNGTSVVSLATVFSKSKKGLLLAIVRALFCFIIGMLTAQAKIFGICSPFGIAAVAAASPKDSIFVLFGAMVGYLLPSSVEYSIRYVAAVITVFLFKFLLSHIEEIKISKLYIPLLAGVPCLITGIAVIAAGDNSPFEVLIFIIEVLLCSCSAIFFYQTSDYLEKPSTLWGLSQRELISVTISCCILLLSLEGIQFSGISLGRILSIFLILAAARYGKENGGAIMGVSTGLFLSLFSTNMSAIVLGYGFGGLIAGVFSPMGRIFCVISFALTNIITSVSNGSDLTSALTCLYEVAVGSILFMIVPEKYLCRLSGLFMPTNQTSEKKVREEVYDKLIKSAETLDEISDMVVQVRSKLKHTQSDDISEVFSTVSETTCKKCGMRMYCWGTVYNDTMNSLNDLGGLLKKDNHIERSDLPKHFAARCCKLNDLIASINSSYALMLAKRSAEIKVDQLRAITAPSFSNSACLMRDLAMSISLSKKRVDGSERIRSALAACGLSSISSEVYIDGFGRLSIEAEIEGRTSHISRDKLLRTLKQSCGRSLDGPKISQIDGEDNIRMLFTQKPELSVSFGEAEIQKTGESLCGDACETFVDEYGRAILILSDGMGCGGRAAVDSNLTIGLMSRLIRCGFSFDDCAKIASTAMLVKSSEESFTTLDIASIDLYNGEVTFMKAGAAATYIRRCGKVERVESVSMPIGILSNVELTSVKTKVQSGDLVVVLSDGAISDDGDDKYIISEMTEFKEDTKSFAKKIAEKAKAVRKNTHDDDITVVAAYIN